MPVLATPRLELRPCAPSDRAGGSESGELGFLLLPRLQGRGFATEVARAVIEYAFGELGLVGVYASVDPEHATSQRVLRKAGLSPAGEERDAEGPYLRFRVRSPRLPSDLPFYGSRRPDLFAIERSPMDLPGLVVRALDRLLPRSGRVLDIGAGEIARGLEEAQRVVAPGGLVAIVNNLGGDEFSALSSRDIAEPVAPFQALGFSLEVVDTCFEFEALAQARELLGFFFGARGREEARVRLSFRVGVFHKELPA